MRTIVETDMLILTATGTEAGEESDDLVVTTRCKLCAWFFERRYTSRDGPQLLRTDAPEEHGLADGYLAIEHMREAHGIEEPT